MNAVRAPTTRNATTHANFSIVLMSRKPKRAMIKRQRTVYVRRAQVLPNFGWNFHTTWSKQCYQQADKRELLTRLGKPSQNMQFSTENYFGFSF